MRNKKRRFHKTAISSAVVLSIMEISPITFANTTTYDDSTSSIYLENAASLGLDQNALFGLFNTSNGAIYKDSTTNTVLTGAVFVVDYTNPSTTVPQFVIGGYNNGVSGVEVKNNTVTIKNGNVDGNVYAGLTHVTIQTNDVTNPVGNAVSSVTKSNQSLFVNNNNVQINSTSGAINADIFGGNALIGIKTGHATANASSAANASNVVNDAQLHSDSNSIYIDTDTTIIGNVLGGSVLIALQSGNAVTTASTTGTQASNFLASRDSQLHSDFNTVTIGSNTTIGKSVLGGSAQLSFQSGSTSAFASPTTKTALATTNISANRSQLYSNLNTVSIGNGVSIEGSVLGGFAQIRQQSGNANIYDGAIQVVSNYANADVSTHADYTKLFSNSNIITMGNDVSIKRSVFGGSSQINLKSGNAVDTNSSDASAVVTSAQLSSDANTISIGDRTMLGSRISGGFSRISIQTGNATSTASSYVLNSKADTYTVAYWAQINTNSNTVSIARDATIEESVFGGTSQLMIKTGNIYVDANSSSNVNTSALSLGTKLHSDSNSVSIDRGTTIGQSVFGGDSQIIFKTGNVYANVSPYVSASNLTRVNTEDTQLFANNNTVNFNGTLNGGNGAIYGGSIVFDIQTGESTIGTNSPIKGAFINTASIAQAINNSVSIEQNATFNATSSLYGGYLSYNTDSGFKPETYNVFSGNTLNYAASTPTTLSTVANFEHYNFTLTPEQKNTGTALITAQHIVLGTDESNTNDTSVLGTQSNIAVVGIHSGSTLNTDDKFILMKSDNPFTGAGAIGQTNYGVAQQGISLLYDVRTDVDTTNNQVTATVLNCGTTTGETCVSPTPTPTPARVNPQLKALSEGFLAGNMLINRGGDIIAYDAVNAINDQNHHTGWAPFIIASGQHNRYNSGSHIKSNDALITGGLSYQLNNITAAVIIEGGWGSYDSYNSFNYAGNVHGDGHNNYYGVALLGRYDFDNGLYTDASLRYGRSHIKFDTNDIRNIATDEKAHYNVRTNYTSAHVGVGYLFPLDDHNELDISTKYLYTSTQGKHVTVAGDPIHFERINSNRVRFNAQFNHNYSTAVTFNTGAGYEYEFDGKAKATTYDAYQIDAPSVKGSTGIISLGANIKPVENSKLSFDSKVQGYFGKREGMNIILKANYAF